MSPAIHHPIEIIGHFQRKKAHGISTPVWYTHWCIIGYIMSLFFCLQGNTYHYRKAIPSILRPYLGKLEIKQTLRTGNKLEDKRKTSLYNEKINKTILAARKVIGKSSSSKSEKRNC
ncbi:DUF6538 domain-containing protein [Maridesulfovibrio sp.]|uniref:DUF6538 domain-containing protein n=1 Tax=unclassified Maridesulfovibrio TaxID=2794999 RepID=UPI003B007927